MPRLCGLPRCSPFVVALAVLAACLLPGAASATGERPTQHVVYDYEPGHTLPDLECASTRPISHCFQQVTSGARNGVSGRLEVDQGDSPFGWNESAEFVRRVADGDLSDGYQQFHPIAPDEGEGDEYWYHISIKPETLGGGIMMQWHGWDGFSPPVSLATEDANTMMLSLFAGELRGDSGAPATSRSLNELMPGQGIARNFFFKTSRPWLGQWSDFVLHIRWTAFPNNGGFVDVYHKFADESEYRLVVSVHSTAEFPRGIPTLHSVAINRDGNTYGDGPHVLTNYLKWGIYRPSWCRQPTDDYAWADPAKCGSTRGVQPPDSRVYDDFRQGLTAAEVLSPGETLPGGVTPTPPATGGGGQPSPGGDDGQPSSGGGGQPSPGAALSYSLVTDPGCTDCAVRLSGSDGVDARIGGGDDAHDTAYATADLGNAASSGDSFTVGDAIALAPGQQLRGNLSVLQVRDGSGSLLYELYLTPDRVLSLWSPPGALQQSLVNTSAGVAVPNDGNSAAVQVVSTPGSGSLVVSVDGAQRLSLTGLSGAALRSQSSLRVGIDHYDGHSAIDPVQVFHRGIAAGAGIGGGSPLPPVTPGDEGGSGSSSGSGGSSSGSGGSSGSGFGGSSGSGTSILPDGSFEDSPAAAYYGVGDGSATWADDLAHSGSHSLELTSDVGGLTRWLTQSAALQVTPGETYDVSVYLHADSVDVGSYGNLVVDFWSGTTLVDLKVAPQRVTGTTDWTQAQLTVTVPLDASTMRLEFRLNGSGTLHVDDASVTPSG